MLPFLLALSLGVPLLAAPASAAPVATDWTLQFHVAGGANFLQFSGSTTVSVTGSTVEIPAGALLLTQPVTQVLPLSGQTVVNQLQISSLANLSGTFSLGGVTNQIPSEACGASPPGSSACNIGGGIGGALALTGTLFIHVIPNIVVFPINLNDARIGQGGAFSPAPSLFGDAAAWSTQSGAAFGGGGTTATFKSPNPAGTSPFTVATPTFIQTFGFQIPVLTVLTLTNVTVVPEPSTLLLLGVGIVGALTVLRTGRRR